MEWQIGWKKIAGNRFQSNWPEIFTVETAKNSYPLGVLQPSLEEIVFREPEQVDRILLSINQTWLV